MELEHDIKVFPIDVNLQDKVNALVQDGWELVPGVQAIAVYHVVRIKQMSQATGALGKLRIDDSKIQVIPAHKKN